MNDRRREHLVKFYSILEEFKKKDRRESEHLAIDAAYMDRPRQPCSAIVPTGPGSVILYPKNYSSRLRQ